MDNNTEFATLVKPFIDAGFRLVDKAKALEDFGNDSINRHNPGITMVASNDTSNMPINYAILNLYKDQPKQSEITLKFKNPDDPKIFDELADLNIFAYEQGDGHVAVIMATDITKNNVLPMNTHPLQNLIDKVYHVADLGIQSKPFPMESGSLDILPYFSDAPGQMQDYDDLELAAAVLPNLGNHQSVMDLTQEQLKYGFNHTVELDHDQVAYTSRRDSPKPSPHAY